MKIQGWLKVAGLIMALGIAVCLYGQKPSARQLTETLGGEERYKGFIAMDKPIYRPGESAYARITVLNALDNSPQKPNYSVTSFIEVKGPKGETVTSGSAQGENGTIGFSWLIPEGQSGGEYTLRASFPNEGFPPAERKFDIRVFRAPRLKSQIVFVRDGYGPGDKAAATLHVERAEGGIPEGAKVTISARVDGNEVHTSVSKVDKEGNVFADFPLPTVMEQGDGTLSFAVEDGGIIETAAKTIPILLQTLDIQIYPEGGDLVQGIPCRVYIESRNSNQKPADINGVILNSKDKAVAEVKTEHEGRGRFIFTPDAEEKYRLQVRQPSGIKKEFSLPPVKQNGVTLFSKHDFYPEEAPLQFSVTSSDDREATLVISKQGHELVAKDISLKAGKTQDISLDAKNGFGVLTATLWDKKGAPLGERLVYSEPVRKLNISVSVAEKKCIPGGKVNLTIKTTDESKKPIGAMVGLTVTDDAVLEMVEKREQAPRLPVMALIESDVKELFDAHVYLDRSNPKSGPAIDLLLGTQGWRRFALADINTFVANNGDAARRVLALRMATEREMSFSGMAPGSARGEEDGIVMEKAMRVPPPMPAAAVNRNEVMPAGKALPIVMHQKVVNDFEARPVQADLKKALEGADKLGKANAMFDEIAPQQAGNMVYVREFAHQVRANRKPGERTDFSETLFWAAGVKTDDKTGEAHVSFDLCDSVTTFRVLADGFTKDGALGAGTGGVEAVEPFAIEPKIPLEVSAGDMIQLPVGVINNLSRDLKNVTFSVEAKLPLEPAGLKPLAVSGGTRGRAILPIYVASGSTRVDLTIKATADEFGDKVTRQVAVKPRGFPIEMAVGGMLSAAKPFGKTMTIPSNLMAGSLTVKAAVYPTPLANLTEAMERLICEPCGCFEQTSSTNYPLVMAQQYFLTHTGIPAATISRSRELLERGYKRLLGFECKDKGYEWFGESPAHEALTAYGLMEFNDMARVQEVDSGMLGRTREWLINARDGKGGFKRERRALHTWITDADCSNGYITWALLTAGEKGLEQEIAWVRDSVAKTEDSYVLALGANVMALAGDKVTARKLLEKLVQKQGKDGGITGAKTSITQSGGDALIIETTALSILAWLRDADFAGAVEKSMGYLVESCKGGRFGSTQSTVLALKAIVEYDKARAKPKAPGSLQIFVDSKPVGNQVKFDEKSKEAIQLPDIGGSLKPGEHLVELKMTDGSEMPFSLTINYYSDKPADSPDCKMRLTTALSTGQLLEGGMTDLKVTVSNKTKDPLPMPVAIIGLPGGLEPRHDQLKELVKAKKIDAYEVLGRELVFYWRTLQPEQKAEFSVSLTAAIPGTYEGPAARAYLYYSDEFKTWVSGLKVAIAPRQ
ncbi:MAG: A-macroglobulin complement component [Candidatus Riflebacteria bacterium]|nr:A-macroglobulin complement component [Candidatus Riflebacteria bacterium]